MFNTQVITVLHQLKCLLLHILFLPYKVQTKPFWSDSLAIQRTDIKLILLKMLVDQKAALTWT